MRRERLMPFAVSGIIALLVASLTHFVAILILPSIATRDSYSQLAARFGTIAGLPTGMISLPPSRPGDDSIPFRDPSTLQALCFFDLTKAALRIKTKTDDRLLMLSFRTPEGRIFYSMTNRAALKETIDIRLVSASQLKEIEAGDAEDEILPFELRLKSPTLKGLMVATVLIARASETTAARERIKAITCEPEPLSPPS